MEYFLELKKPGAMDPNKLLLKLQAYNYMVRDIPGAPVNNSGFNNAHICLIHNKEMPNHGRVILVILI